MKKLFTSLVCCLLAFSMVIMTGCSSVFNGNYVEASAEEVNTFAAQTEAVEDNEDFNYAAGVQLKSSVYVKYIVEGEQAVVDISMDYKTILEDGDLKAQGSVKMDIPGEHGTKMNAQFWQADGFMYLKGTSSMQEGEVKAKYPMSFDDMFGDLIDSFSEVSLTSDLSYYLEMAGSFQDTVKFYIEKTETTNKIKIEVPETTIEGSSVSLLVVMVYDANYRITAAKVDAKLTEGDLVMKTNFELQAWNGSVSLPSDAADYTFAGM